MTTQAEERMPPPPSWTHVESDVDYHARSKCGDYMSSGMLNKFRECPYAYHLAVKGIMQDKDTAAYRFGRAVHKMILEGSEAFNKSYCAGGPINPKTGKAYGVGTKAFDEWLVAEGINREQIVTPEELEILKAMNLAVLQHSCAANFLHFGWPELVMRGLLHGVHCQSRMDWLTHDETGAHVIVDLKTTDDISWFNRDAQRYGYLNQFAFYRDIFESVTGKPVSFAVIAVEKKMPFRVGVWYPTTEDLDHYSAVNKDTLCAYLECLQKDEWPTGYEAPRNFRISERI